jgi:hypothetical protein
MLHFLRTAQILDSLQCYRLADKFTKFAIDMSDLDPHEVYKNPQTYSDSIVKKSLETNQDPFLLIDRKQPDQSKGFQENLASMGEKHRRYLEIYPQILVFPKSGLWKFFFTDPLSFGALHKGSEKSGKLLTDQLTVPGLMEDFEDEVEKENIEYDVLFTTNLPTEDFTLAEAIDKIRKKFPGASVDYNKLASDVDGSDLFDAEKNIEL